MRSLEKPLTITIYDFYDLYRKERKTWKYKLNKKDFIKVTKFILWRIARSLIVDRLRFKPPYFIGEWVIEKVKPYDIRTNQARSANSPTPELWNNRHTFGSIFRYRWLNEKSRNRMLRFAYVWEAVRDGVKEEVGKRGLKKYILECADDPNKPDFKATY